MNEKFKEPGEITFTIDPTQVVFKPFSVESDTCQTQTIRNYLQSIIWREEYENDYTEQSTEIFASIKLKDIETIVEILDEYLEDEEK